MAIAVGDLWPQTSGTSALGAEMDNGGFTGAIVPFSAVYMNSGIFHDINGQSGVLRYNAAQNAFEISINGGNTFDTITSTTGITLQRVYDTGDNIILHGQANQYKGILVRELPGYPPALKADLLTAQSLNYGIAVSGFSATPGNPNSVSLARLLSNALTITPSGAPTFTAATLFLGFDPDILGTAQMYTSGIIRISADKAITISSATLGTTLQSLHSDCTVATFGIDGDVNLQSKSDVFANAFDGSGNLRYRMGPFQSWAIKTTDNNTGGPKNDGYWPIAHSGNVNEMIMSQVDYDIVPKTSGTAHLGFDSVTKIFKPYADIHQNSGVFHAPYGGSGLIRFTQLTDDNGVVMDAMEISDNGGLNYNMRIGSTANYGFLHSQKMFDIFASGGFQLAGLGATRFNIKRSPSLGGNLGDLTLTVQNNVVTASKSNQTYATADITMASVNKTVLGPLGTDATLNISGVFVSPTTNLASGDLFMMLHSVISGVVGVTSFPVVQARALGIGTLALNTGSGIVNVSVGSGIAQFYNSTNQPLNTSLTNIGIDTCLESADMNYGCGTIAANTSGVITVFSPGLYKISYKVGASKTIGASAQMCTFRLEKNNSGSAIFGSTCNTQHASTTVSDQSTSNVIVINLDPGDTISLKGSSSAAGANNCSVLLRGALIVMEKIGPKRGAAGS
jgi:hypothetical protein